ncbi:uncharacterized protein BP5553_04357 [Venustampulla echinocandica]|uniref:Tyrosinase copper-binding domain-containing protein n=1 Tax=Venustampulla echinocandica TaxID=2656787 RepID=A0A370TWW6_9HELO|nr:uncharacterized protein BP5553_04357 [Venustampulla echinocandica]RDL40017.1 hypothetical protein BP5553_04357 [Venustampulla echinocandica]
MTILKNLAVFLTALSAFADVSVGTPVAAPLAESLPRATCTNPVLRKEWSAATAAERSSYISAVLCLATKPSRINLSTTLYDDFVYVHNSLTDRIHGVAQFLPWHRYFIHVYEQALKDCGYTGVAMYWNWAADSAAPSAAKVWSPVDGFGGNGNQSTPDVPFSKCVTDGPFTGLTLAYYNTEVRPHCLMRDFQPAHPEAGLQDMIGFQFTPEIVAEVSAYPDFSSFHGALESRPHAVVHAGVSGDMGPATSPNDPIFFLHHTMVDRIWWLWQQQNPSVRTNDFSGTEYAGVAATLDDLMPMMGIATDRKVGDFMSTSTTDLCYKY